MSNQKTDKKTDATQAMHDMQKDMQESMTAWMRTPVQMGELMMKQAQATQQASMEYFRALEKIQRESAQNMAELWNTLLPGENQIWKTQMEMMEKGFDMAERVMRPVA